jgi:hypothetical protein
MWIAKIWEEANSTEKLAKINWDGSNIENSDQELRNFW